MKKSSEATQTLRAGSRQGSACKCTQLFFIILCHDVFPFSASTLMVV